MASLHRQIPRKTCAKPLRFRHLSRDGRPGHADLEDFLHQLAGRKKSSVSKDFSAVPGPSHPAKRGQGTRDQGLSAIGEPGS
ncbi:hypothetical protein ElyMa_001532000 [Elysia marginata]|uniref:Myelin basic protein n=1 Tax=Elysia marginata TaxID=1093978 RepID=A0AAV4J7S4_9GAST|nr:hypothetical protein ElyMa_001532000 [Elysia marginata]